MTQSIRDEDALLTLAFSLRATPGAYALLLGAGVSAPSGIPTAWGVLTDLTSRVAELSGADASDPVVWYEEQFKQAPRYETLLERLAPTQLERQRLLRAYFEPTSEDVEAGRKAPTAAHLAIARMVRTGAVRVIVTMNFDRLMETAIRAEGIEPTVVATPAEVEGLAPLHTLDCCIVHLHGDYLNPTSMLNTTAELNAYQPETERLLQRILENYGLIIAGWSSTYDPALRDAISRHYPSRFTLTWIEPGQPTQEATELRIRKSGLLLPATADTAFGELADAVDALTARNSRHPMTVAVAVETAKRELAGRQVAIGLHDRLNREFSRLHDLPDFRLPDYQSDTAYGGYAAILGRVEEASKLCSALVATLAYWGSPTTDEWWLNELTRFSTTVRGNGLTALLSIKRIAGTFLYYAAGIAAVAAQRYDLLARVLKAQGPHRYRYEQEPLVEALDADRVYTSEIGSARLHTLLCPLLVEALALGEEPIEDAWQTFEVLRLASALISHPGFEARLSRLKETTAASAAAQAKFEAAEQNGADTTAERDEMREAEEDKGRALGSLANIAGLRRPHILIVDHMPLHRSPVAEGLARDIAAETDAHPLIAAKVARDPTALQAAVEAVSVAGGRLGEDLGWSRLPSGGGILPNDIWLDTAKTLEELAMPQ
ncbi:hypothetical protein HH310_25520 [Actinoplanes sp. TBRC 11911]|uniref:SIR2 family protein n=1 Tax=Actinoplanes sp. TBRC 11911 TaxID=2729386 RepID=UPI00145DE420|nr:SIR2 family protein [Actinoplanes sp. TBRC 11911]NMO54530.1 hypothetical protein [Actinoplanes sp. TBRC 11911]